MNQSDDRNKSMANYRQNPTDGRGGLNVNRSPVILSALQGFTIGFFIAATVVVCIRVTSSETDGMNALVQSLMILVPAIVLTVIARILHKRSKSKGRVSKSIARFVGLLGLATGAAIWVAAPTQHQVAQKMLDDHRSLLESRVEQLADCRSQIEAYPTGSLKKRITSEQLAELKTVKMNLKRSKYNLSEGWNALLTTDTDFARLKPGTNPEEMMDDSDRPKSSFRSPDVYTYSREFSKEIDDLAEMTYGDPYLWPSDVEEFLEFFVPMRYVIIVRMGEINPAVLTGKQFISGYVSGEAFCFELEKKKLIAAFTFETTNSTKIEYTYKKNANVTAVANSAGHSLQENLLNNTWPAFWNRFHELASASASSNQTIELPYQKVALDEARLNVLRKRVMDAQREKKVKQGMAELESKSGTAKDLKSPVEKLTPESEIGNLSAEQKEEIRKLLKEKGKLAAIKRYREVTRASLLESKNAVEAIERSK